jgi:hypothetical protein
LRAQLSFRGFVPHAATRVCTQLTFCAIVPRVHSLAPFRLGLRRERGRCTLPSAPPLTARVRSNRFAGWLCVCLLILQALAVECHVSAAVLEGDAGVGHAALASICSASGSPIQPADGPQKAPAKNACACVFHTCGCCPAVLTGTASLLPRPKPAAVRSAGFSGIGFTAKAILGNVSVRGPPAFST